MHELEQVLIGDSAASPPAVILESLDDSLAHRIVQGAPRSIYEELWHITYWQQVTLEWVEGIETPYPVHPSAGFPSEDEKAHEDWDTLRQRFFRGNQQAAAIARDAAMLERQVELPIPTRLARPHHVGERATGEPGGPQRVPLRQDRAPAAACRCVAAAVRWL